MTPSPPAIPSNMPFFPSPPPRVSTLMEQAGQWRSGEPVSPLLPENSRGASGSRTPLGCCYKVLLCPLSLYTTPSNAASHLNPRFNTHNTYKVSILSYFILWLLLWHLEVPRLEVESELQLLAYTTATAMTATSMTYITARGNARSLTH